MERIRTDHGTKQPRSAVCSALSIATNGRMEAGGGGAHALGVSKASWCVIRLFCAASVACRRLIIDLTLHVASPSTRVHRSLDISSCCPARGRETVCVCARIADMVLDIGVGTVLRHTHACAIHRMRHTHRMRRTHRTRHTHRMRHTHTRATHTARAMRPLSFPWQILGTDFGRNPLCTSSAETAISIASRQAGRTRGQPFG